MTSSITIVLVHGAGTGPWVWGRVVQALSVPTLAIQFPGRVTPTTPDEGAAEVVTQLDERGLSSVLLVLHSVAGVLAPGLAARLGHRMRKCVFLAAVIPPNGGSFVDTLSFPERLIIKVLFRLNRNGLKPSAAMIRREL